MRGDAQYERIESALNEFEKILGRVLSEAEKTLFERLTTELTGRLSVEDGQVERSARISAIIDDVFAAFDKDEMPKVIRALVSQIVEVVNAGKGYFTVMGLASERADRLTGELMKSLGLEVNQRTFKLIAGGYLESVTRTTEVKLKVLKAALNGVFGESDYRSFLRDLRGIIESSGQKDGVLTRYYKTFAYDLVQRAARVQGKQLAEAANLKAFIYSGTVIEETRPFCKSRAGKVFTTKEAEAWKDEEWSGKNEDYNPLRDLGGHNCRHRVRWISSQEAIRRRPELKGKL